MLEKAFSAIDLFGVPIELNFAKANKARSAFGGFFSLLFIALLIWCSYNSAYELITREKPQVVDGTYFAQDRRPVEITSRNFPLVFAVIIPGGIVDTTFCIYQVVYYADQEVPEFHDMEKCTPDHFDDELPQLTEGTELSDFYCFPRYAESRLTSSAFMVYLACPPQDGFEEFLARMPIATTIYPKYGLTLQEYDSPVQRYSEIDESPLKAGTMSYMLSKINHMNITTDDGWVTSEERTDEYIELSAPTLKEFEAEVTQIFYTFELTEQESYHLRTYRKLQDFLGEVGGVIGLLFPIFYVLVTPYARMKYSEAFVNEMFDIQFKKAHKQTMTKSSSNRLKRSTSGSLNRMNHARSNKSVSNIELKRLDNMQKLDTSSPHENQILHTEEGLLTEDKSKVVSSLTQRESESPNKPLNRDNDETQLFTIHQEFELPPLKSRSDSKPNAHSVLFGPHLTLIKAENSYKQPPENELPNIIQLEDIKTPVESANNIEIQVRSRIESKSQENNKGEESKASATSKEEAKEEEEVIKQENEIQLETEGNVDPNAAIQEEKRELYNKAEVFIAIDTAFQEPKKKTRKKKSQKALRITLLEYLRSFVSRSEELKEKRAILDEGLKIIDNRLDIVHVLKRLRDIDKMKNLMLDKDQLLLFDRLKRPDLLDRESHWYTEEGSCEVIGEFNSNLKALGIEDQITRSKETIRNKPDKTEIDQKLLQLI